MQTKILGIEIHIPDDAWEQLRMNATAPGLSENATRALCTALAELGPREMHPMGGLPKQTELYVVAKAVALVTQWRNEYHARESAEKVSQRRVQAADNEARAAYLNAKARGVVTD